MVIQKFSRTIKIHETFNTSILAKSKSPSILSSLRLVSFLLEILIRLYINKKYYKFCKRDSRKNYGFDNIGIYNIDIFSLILIDIEHSDFNFCLLEATYP